jgi:hypothetical protein
LCRISWVRGAQYHVFPDLELEPASLELRLLDCAQNRPHQMSALELNRGKVHGHLDRLRPGRRIGARPLERPLPHAHDEPGLLGARDEIARRDEPPLGVVPAHQGFEARDLTRLEVDDGLVVENELSAIECILEVVLELVARANLLVLFLGEERKLAAAGKLGLVQRDVHVLQIIDG